MVKFMLFRPICLAFSSALLLSATPLSAQAPASSPPIQTGKTEAVIRSSTRLVEINVLVHDKKGNPVRGLTKEDFTLLDQGQLQNISLVYSDAGAPAVSASAAPLPPNVYTNRSVVPGNVSVILFDALNTTIQDQQYARDQVIKVLRQLSPEDHVAIYLLTRRLQILHDFTFDLNVLLHAVNQFTGFDAAHMDPSLSAATGDANAQPGTPGNNSMDAEGNLTLQQFLAGVSSQRYEDYVNVDRALITAQAFEAIADHLANIPGRKSVVWISGGFPLFIGMDSDTANLSTREMRNFEGEIKRATQALNQSDIAVYPVDARGLLVSSTYGARGRPLGFGPMGPNLNSGPNQNDFATMELLATRTGGKPFYSENDLEKGVRFAINDGKLAYTLGFYPSHGKWDGKFHELKVVVKSPGAQVRYRKGYFATPEPVYQPSEAKAAMEAAVWSPVESTGLRLQVMVNPSKTPKVLELKIALDTRELRLVEEQGHWKGAIDLSYVQLGPADKSVLFDYKHLNLNLEQKNHDALMRMGMVLSHDLPVAPKTTVVRVVVRDASTGALGTVTVPLEKYLAAQLKEMAR
jgi:VWFA-related protein